MSPTRLKNDEPAPAIQMMSDAVLIDELRDYLKAYEESGFSGDQNMAALATEVIRRYENQ